MKINLYYINYIVVTIIYKLCKSICFNFKRTPHLIVLSPSYTRTIDKTRLRSLSINHSILVQE